MNAVGKLVFAFVALILGLALAANAATMVLGVTEKSNIADESIDLNDGCYDTDGKVQNADPACDYTLAQAPTSWKVLECPLTSVVVTNKTGTALTLTTDYTVDASTGIISFLDTAATNTTHLGDNTTLVDYTYCADDYMNLAWGRTAMTTSIGFFALALLMVALALFWSVAKETGLLN